MISVLYLLYIAITSIIKISIKDFIFYFRIQRIPISIKCDDSSFVMYIYLHISKNHFFFFRRYFNLNLNLNFSLVLSSSVEYSDIYNLNLNFSLILSSSVEYSDICAHIYKE